MHESPGTQLPTAVRFAVVFLFGFPGALIMVVGMIGVMFGSGAMMSHVLAPRGNWGLIDLKGVVISIAVGFPAIAIGHLVNKVSDIIAGIGVRDLRPRQYAWIFGLDIARNFFIALSLGGFVAFVWSVTIHSFSFGQAPMKYVSLAVGVTFQFLSIRTKKLRDRRHKAALREREESPSLVPPVD